MYSLRWALGPFMVACCWALPFDEEFHSPSLARTLVVTRIPRHGPVRKPSELQVVDAVVPLTRAGGHSLSSVYTNAIRLAAAGSVTDEHAIKRDITGIVPLTSIAGSVFTIPVAIGGQPFNLVVDTGSSDPWVASDTFTCLDVFDKSQRGQEFCRFGRLYDETSSSSFSQIPDENFNVTYADGENLNGIMGYETISVAGLTVTEQKFGVVEEAAWFGDDVSSGLIGFAYSTLTSAYRGGDPANDVKGQQVSYSPVFTNIHTRGLAAPIFSIAMSRNSSNAGVLAVGGIPDVPHSPYFATVPIQPVGINVTNGEYVYQFYSIVIDGWAWSASQYTQFNVAGTRNPFKIDLVGANTQVIVDSGTTLIYAPNSVAAGIANSYDPPAEYNPQIGAYTVRCSAKPPVVGVSIGKKIFYVHPSDLFTQGPEGDLCYTGVQPNLGGLSILGDAWMKSVLAVFDIGAEQMRFSARQFYDTPPCNDQTCPGVV